MPLIIAALLIAAAGVIAAFYLGLPHANLRVTIGPQGSPAYHFIKAFAEVTEANHPRVRVKLVTVADLEQSAKANEKREVELGIARSDVDIPENGDTIAISRQDAVAFLAPPKSPVDSIPALAGKTIGAVEGPGRRQMSERSTRS